MFVLSNVDDADKCGVVNSNDSEVVVLMSLVESFWLNVIVEGFDAFFRISRRDELTE